MFASCPASRERKTAPVQEKLRQARPGANQVHHQPGTCNAHTHGEVFLLLVERVLDELDRPAGEYQTAQADSTRRRDVKALAKSGPTVRSGRAHRTSLSLTGLLWRSTGKVVVERHEGGGTISMSSVKHKPLKAQYG